MLIYNQTNSSKVIWYLATMIPRNMHLVMFLCYHVKLYLTSV